MPTEPKSATGTGCGGMQETGGIGTARSNATEDAKIVACCGLENVDTFENIDEKLYSVGKRTCMDITAHITCVDSARSCIDKNKGNPKL